MEGPMKLVKKLKQPSTIEGLIAVAAATVMLFTPEHIDQIIETGLSVFGVKRIVLDD